MSGYICCVGLALASGARSFQLPILNSIRHASSHRFTVPMEPSVNVLDQPLETCSTDPMTGFMRNGKCDTGPMDGGSHTLAAQVTPQFLEFSAGRGNDLRSILTPGCRWCLCVSRWKEALDAYRGGQVAREAVPSVLLSATHKMALNQVTMNDLKEFAMDQSPAGQVADPAAGGPIR